MLRRKRATVFVPRDAPDFELNIVSNQRLAEVAAIIFDGVGRQVRGVRAKR